MSDQISAKDVNEAMRNISKGPDLRQEMALVAGADANWEEFLVPGPICIAIMGDLLLTSTQSDFTLDKNAPEGGFKHLKYPKSFRACLMQVVNAGYNAFNTAHKNMDNIRHRASNTTDQVKQAVQILLRGTNEELEQMLQIPLGNIKETADQCLSLAQQVEGKFQFVMDLTGELLEACVNVEGATEEELTENKIAVEIAKESKVAAQERKDMDSKNMKRLEKSVNDAEKSYYKAMDSMPSGWSMIGMSLVEGITTAFVGAISGTRKRSTNSQKSSTKKDSLSDSDVEGYSLASRMEPFINNLVAYIYLNGELNQRALEKTDNITYCKQQLLAILRDSKSCTGEVMKRVNNLCKEGIEICMALEKAAKQFRSADRVVQEQAGQLCTLQTEIQTMSTEGKVRMGSNPTDMTPPNQATYQREQCESATQQAVQDARFKIEQTTAHLNNARENFDKTSDRLAESSKRLHEVLANMKKLDIQEKSLKDIKETLRNGIRALGELREKWGKIVMFFQMMSNIIECSLSKSLKGFLKYSHVASEQTLQGYPITSLKRDMIYHQAFEAAKIAHLVNMISSSYVEVSQAHLMERIAGLGKLLAYDPDKDKSVIARKRLQLFEGCEEAQFHIRTLVLRRKEEFDRQINARMQAVRHELNAVIPAVQDGGESQKRIQDAVKKGIEKAKEADPGSGTSHIDDIVSHYEDI